MYICIFYFLTDHMVMMVKDGGVWGFKLCTSQIHDNDHRFKYFQFYLLLPACVHPLKYLDFWMRRHGSWSTIKALIICICIRCVAYETKVTKKLILMIFYCDICFISQQHDYTYTYLMKNCKDRVLHKISIIMWTSWYGKTF